MGRGKLSRIPAVVAFGLASVRIVWSPFSSATYPYAISMPSSFRAIVIHDISNVPVDYFFPPLSSSITNLNVKAVPGHTLTDEAKRLKELGGRHVRTSAWLHIADQRVPVICADFKGLTAQYTIERVTFLGRGMVWYVTASYDHRYRNKIRPTLLRMMRSFRLRP